MKVQVKDSYGNVYEATLIKVGRKYAYATVEFGFGPEVIPFERTTGRTSQGYEESRNAIPMFLQK